MKWLTVPLRKIAPPKPSSAAFPAAAPVWHLSLDQIESGTGEIFGKKYADAGDAGSSTFSFDAKNVLYSKLRPYLNKVAIPDELGIATTELVPLCPDTAVLDQKYLACYLRSASFVNQASHHVAGAKMPRVVMDWFWEHQMPLPPLSEQWCIVEILDEADHLLKLRRKADAKAACVMPALFLKMFGDPVTNPKGWQELSLRAVIVAVEAGWSAVSEARARQENEYGVLKVSAVTSGRFLSEEHKAVREAAIDKPLVVPRRGDLLFSRANTRELVAASCVVEEDHPKLFLPDKIWRVTPKAGQATSIFLKELFWQNGFRNRLRASASGSSGSMLNISQESMLRTLAPIPPFELQEQFSALAWKLADIANNRRIAGERISTLWENLIQRAFSGALTARWRTGRMKELMAEMKQQARLLNLPPPSIEQLTAEA